MEQVKKAFCYQKLFWPFTVWMNCSSDLTNFANSRLTASNSKIFSRSLEQFFLTVGQNNFGNKIPISISSPIVYHSTLPCSLWMVYYLVFAENGQKIGLLGTLQFRRNQVQSCVVYVCLSCIRTLGEHSWVLRKTFYSCPHSIPRKLTSGHKIHHRIQRIFCQNICWCSRLWWWNVQTQILECPRIVSILTFNLSWL